MSKAGRGLWGVFITTAGNLLEYAVGIITSIIVARSLMPESFGVVSQAVWIASLLIMACSHGTSTTAIVFVAEASGAGNEGLGRNIWGHLNRISLISSFAILLVFCAVAAAHPPSTWTTLPLVLVGLIAIAALSKTRSTALTGLALSHHLFTIAAVASAVASVAYLCGSLIVAWIRPTIDGFVIAYAASAVMAYLVIATYLRRKGHVASYEPLDTGLRGRVNRHLKLTAMLVAVGQASNRVIESFLISVTRSTAEFGYFSIAGALTRGAVEIITSGLQVTLMPLMAHAKSSGGPGALVAMLNTAMRCYLAAGLLVAGAGAFAVAPVVMILYGESYNPAIPAAQIAMIGAGIGLTAAATGAFQSVTERQDMRVMLAGLSLAANVVLALVFVPLLGVTGAALSFGATRVLAAILGLVAVSRVADAPVEKLQLLRFLLAGAIAAAPSLATYNAVHHVWAGAIAACVFTCCYITLTLAFRAWKRTDLDQLAGAAQRLPFGAQATSNALDRMSRAFGAA